MNEPRFWSLKNSLEQPATVPTYLPITLALLELLNACIQHIEGNSYAKFFEVQMKNKKFIGYKPLLAFSSFSIIQVKSRSIFF